MAARSETWACGRSLAGIVGSDPAGSMECYVWSGRGLCDRPTTGLEDSYRMWWCWAECDSEGSTVRKPRPSGGCRATAGGGGEFNKFIDIFSVHLPYSYFHVRLRQVCLLENLALSVVCVRTAAPNFILVFRYGTQNFRSLVQIFATSK